MRTVQVERFGGPEELVVREVAEPVAGPGQVVVDVGAADTLWVETMIRQGLGGEHFGFRPPYVPGGAVAGTVRSTGDGADPALRGRRVAVHVDGGGYAERVVAAADRLAEIPDGLGTREAAALLHDAVTALAVHDAAAPKPGEWVLVTGASGGLGLLLVQLAKAAGAHVAATARGPRKLALAEAQGADLVVDTEPPAPDDPAGAPSNATRPAADGTSAEEPRSAADGVLAEATGLTADGTSAGVELPGWAERVTEATGVTGPDVVLDGVGGQVGAAAFAIVADGGRFSAHGTPAGSFAPIDPAEAERRRVTVRGIQDVQLSPAERRDLTIRALAEAARGRLRPVIGQTYPLAEAAKAHEAIETRQVTAKTLLLP